MTSRLLTGGLALSLALWLCGCGASKPLKRLFGKDGFPQATAENPVVEVVSIWQPAEGTGLDGLPTRGFAGQLLFFTRGSEQPCQVNGAVRVYLFENTGPVSERVRPIHQFDFTPESWNTYLYEGTLGATYQLFVPYPKRNPHQTSCSLRVRFEPVGGPRVFSDSVNVTLPGPVKPEDPAVLTTPKAAGPSMRSLSIPLRPQDGPRGRAEQAEPTGATRDGAAAIDEPTSAAPSSAAGRPTHGEQHTGAQPPAAPPASPAENSVGSTAGGATGGAEADRLREIESMLAKLLAERSAAIHASAARYEESRSEESRHEQGQPRGSHPASGPPAAGEHDAADYGSAAPKRFRLARPHLPARHDPPPQNPLADPPEPGRPDFDSANARPASFDALLQEHAPQPTAAHPLAEFSE